MKKCSVDSCDRREKLRRGWCLKHYKRWQRHGDPTGRVVFHDPEKAFAVRTEWRNGCLVWTGHLVAGYGRLRVKGKMVLAHRYSWERENGPIPEEIQIDHICFNRACVNVEHLRLATLNENRSNRSGSNLRNKLGARNVYPLPNGSFKVQIQKENNLLYFGTYKTIEEAKAVAEKARQELFGEFAGRG